jgi:hypoxanthine phosphoribosyltransferase
MPVSSPALDVLISEERLHERITALAAIIDKELEPGEVPLLIGVLKGSIHFLSDLARALRTDSEIDFMQVSSYRGQKSSSGVVQIKKDLDTNIEGRSVYIIEDIVDTGATLSHLRELLATRKPKSLKIVSLLSKLEARHVAVEVEHVGFEIPNEFVVGYGLDYGERYRNLPFIAILRDPG